jgi:hypothetical protein
VETSRRKSGQAPRAHLTHEPRARQPLAVLAMSSPVRKDIVNESAELIIVPIQRLAGDASASCQVEPWRQSYSFDDKSPDHGAGVRFAIGLDQLAVQASEIRLGPDGARPRPTMIGSDESSTPNHCRASDRLWTRGRLDDPRRRPLGRPERGSQALNPLLTVPALDSTPPGRVLFDSCSENGTPLSR